MADETRAWESATPTDSRSESYNGWTNRETWAVALHINNDQGWQESVLEALREADPRKGRDDIRLSAAREAGEVIRENVEETLEMLWEFRSDELRNILTDFGSLWRVDWTELGAAFLSDLAEADAYADRDSTESTDEQ